MKKTKSLKYAIGSLATLLISGSIVCAAIGCSNNSSNTNNNTSTQKNTTIEVSGFKNNNGNNNYDASYGNKITLSANNENIVGDKGDKITYKWYCNNQLIKNVTTQNYSFFASALKTNYYVETFVNGVMQAKSKVITINPVFDASKFSTAIYENGEEVNSINDINNSSSYNLTFKLLYNKTIFSIQPTNNIVWEVNNKIVANNNSASFSPNLIMGINSISATFNNLSPIYHIKDNTLSSSININYASLQITSNNVTNNQISIKDNGSVTLSVSKDSLASFADANIDTKNITYKWYENDKLISTDNSLSATFNNITANTDFYLNATYTINKKTYTWTSNTIKVIVNPVQNLKNAKIIYNSNDNSTSLNLTSSNISQAYNFSINSDNDISNINATVTYTLTNESTKKTITLASNSISLDKALSINFSDLKDFSYGKYVLSASISITLQDVNNSSTSTIIKAQSLNITYSAISISPTSSNNIKQINQSNTYDVNVGSSITLNTNQSNVNVNGKISYQWQEQKSGTWTNILNATSDSYTISDLTSASALTYRLIETINSLTINSNAITIAPTISSQLTATITSNNSKTTNNTLNIYSSKDATQTLNLSLSNNINTSDLSGLSVTWSVNKIKKETGNSLSFTNTYNIGQNEITANITFTLDNKQQSLTASFIINYYVLKISATYSSISYGANTDTDSISFGNDTNSYIYQNASYQWEINGKVSGTKLDEKPTTLPSYLIQTTQPITFTLIVYNDTNSTDASITSNTITITPSNTSIQAKLTSSSGSNGSLDIYSNITNSNESSSPYTFTLGLTQDNKAYTGTLNNDAITWTLSLDNKTVVTVTNSDLSYNLALNDLTKTGTYTLSASIKLVGIQTAIVATYTINYSQLTISSASKIYYDNNGTLSVNETSFGSLITKPYYFWQIQKDNAWTTISSSSNSSSSYAITNLTSSHTYRVIVGNASTLSKSTVQIISNSLQVTPTALSDLNYDINVNDQSSSSSYTITASSTVYTFSLTNIKDIAGTINSTNATGTLTWTVINKTDNNKQVETKTITLSSSTSSTNWTNFTYAFSTYGDYSVEARLSINNVSVSDSLIKTSSVAFKVNQTTLNMNYAENGGYAQWWVQQQLTYWVNSSDSFNGFISQYAVEYQLDAIAADFDNYQVYFSQMPADDGFGNQQFLTIRAVSNKPINVNTWNGNSFVSSSLNAIPSGSLFTWTLPYELSQLVYSTNTSSTAIIPNGSVGIPMLNYSKWINTQKQQQTISTPFGLSIGSLFNPTSISDNGEFSQAVNGVIAINYGNSNGSPYTPPKALYNQYGGTVSSSPFDDKNTLTISSPQIITFNTSGTYDGTNITSANFSGNYSYTITNKSANINCTGSGSLSSNSNYIFNYDFNQPGKYTITLKYSFSSIDVNSSSKDVSVDDVNKSVTYYVIYNKPQIEATTLTPNLGATDTLKINNDTFYNPTTNATYQWYKWNNGQKTIISGATNSTYTVTINHYKAPYQYIVAETVNGVTYYSSPIKLTPNLTHFSATSTITSLNANTNNTITMSNPLTQTFNLSVKCYGTTYNSTNASDLNQSIVWYVNDKVQTNQTGWSFNYLASSIGTYKIYAIISFTLYGKTFSVQTNTITINANILNYDHENYVEDAINNWTNSNLGVSNANLDGTLSNSSFSDLIDQNLAGGYKITNNYQSFSDVTVSFTKLPSTDDTVLGTLANDEWLTITATSNQAINLSSTKTEPKGTLFTWTLPYALSDITNNLNSLSLNVSTKYNSAINNESLPVPFGLSIGNSSTSTSLSNNLTGNDHGVLASEYGSDSDSYNLPSIWTIAYNQDAAFANLFASDINNNSTLANTNESAATFITNLISEWMSGFRLFNYTYDDFNNWYVSWSPSQINGYTVLELSAYNNVQITPQYWDNPDGPGKTMTGCSIPVDSYFSWTLPYYEGGLVLDNTTISNNPISYSEYFSQSGGPQTNWENPPLGLSIGTSPSDPTSISSNTAFTKQYSRDTSYDGVIAIGYTSGNTNYTPDLTFNMPSQPAKTQN